MLKQLFKSRKAPAEKALVSETSAVKPGNNLYQRLNSMLSARSNTPRGAFGLKVSQANVRNAMEKLRTHQDPGAYAELMETALRSIPKLASTWNTRKLAVTGQIPYVVETGNEAVDKACLDFLRSVEVRKTFSPLLLGIYLGLAAVELVWEEDRPGKLRKLERSVPVSPRNLTFDSTGRVPLLLPAEAGGTPLELDPFKFAIHVPEHSFGHVYESGLAFQLLPIAFTSPAVVGLLLGLIERYGEPIRVGNMPDPETSRLTPDEEEQLAKVLLEALQSLGSDAYGLLPAGAKIELIEAASSNSTGALHQVLLRYADEIIATVILGASLTSGTSAAGSNTNALGNVHNEVRQEYTRADKEALALTVKRDILEPFVRLNFGDDVEVPEVYFQAETGKDVQATVENVAKLLPYGLKVSQTEMREMLGLREPETDEELLEAPAAPDTFGQPLFSAQSFSGASTTSSFSAEEGDEIDAIIKELDEAEMDRKLLTAIKGAKSLVELQAALQAFTKDAGEQAPGFAEQSAAACACCSAAGSAGANLGGA
ncbi:DUF935 family protein [Comamonas testosteroni]|uniref:DUF935 family protein n=1 Tax=Comamonas testosteroni TaxID=285 RepID=A0A373FR70_COMTE|nr:DUF935 family protein [Comamonas testosteroni]RGE46656.1 DUF935 family protein [Comamonas testosteroni]